MEETLDGIVREAVEIAIQKHLPLVDEQIKARCEGRGYAPELNGFLSDRIKELVSVHVDNYLRLQAQAIQTAVTRAVDAKLEQTITGIVNARLERIKRRISEIVA